MAKNSKTLRRGRGSRRGRTYRRGRGSRRGRTYRQRGGVDEYDLKARQFLGGLIIDGKPAIAQYMDLKRTKGNKAAFDEMMLRKAASLQTANVPYSSNDSSLSSLYQHYGLT